MTDRDEAEKRALVADLARAQMLLQARTEQLRSLLSSRWYSLARWAWWARRPWSRRPKARPRIAGEGSFARPLSSAAITAEAKATEKAVAASAPVPVPGLEGPAAGASRLLIAGHSLGFAAAISRAAGRAGATVREDRWRGHDSHDEDSSAAALAWADTVLCEWCLGNAAWYSHNKRPGQRLVVRFHRMELETEYPGELELEAVDAMVFVARHVLERACDRFGWDPGDPRFAILPNGVDLAALGQPKLPEAAFTLAIVGYVPRLKRLDRALDLLEALRARDQHWRLAVKGREPWENPFVAPREEEREYFAAVARRLDRSPGLREAVRFEPFGDDVAAFLRGVGWIVSASEIEGHSVAVAEGMASAAVPVIFDRPGAREQYGERWVHADPAAAASAIEELLADGRAEEAAAAAREAAARWSWTRLEPLWQELLGAGSG